MCYRRYNPRVPSPLGPVLSLCLAQSLDLACVSVSCVRLPVSMPQTSGRRARCSPVMRLLGPLSAETVSLRPSKDVKQRGAVGDI